jgi:hypothetical protein
VATVRSIKNGRGQNSCRQIHRALFFAILSNSVKFLVPHTYACLRVCYSSRHFKNLNFRCFLNVVCFLLGNSPSSEFYMPTFLNTLCVQKRRHIKFRGRRITQKVAYSMAFFLALWRMPEKWNLLQQQSVSHILIILLSVILRCVWSVSSVGTATDYGLDGPGIESRWGGRDFPPVQTGPGAHPAFCTISTGSFPEVKCGRGVLLTTHPLLALRSWKSRAILLPPPLGHNRACNGVTLPFYITPINTQVLNCVFLSTPLLLRGLWRKRSPRSCKFQVVYLVL